MKYAITLSCLATLVCASPALSDTALPWKTNNTTTSAPSQTMPLAQPPHHARSASSAPMQAASSASTREEDDHHLNMLSLEYHKEAKNIGKLSSLRKEVKSFEKALSSRPYDVKDIIKDTRRLDATIGAQIKKLQAATTPPVSKPQ